MDKDIKDFIFNCGYCAAARLPRFPLHPNAEMGLATTPERFDTVAMDVLSLTGSPTPRGNLKVLVMQDLKTRYSVAEALPDESGEQLARAFFERWIAVFGAPRKIMAEEEASCLAA